ncbi:LysR family transcriptional regulator [Asaia siamensis]|uniref:Transcriptional regulator n=1 Tax=Asaia siamensis TaxID=110479 RepID=A0ABQ1MDP9_9PROT|nr:LysR family transcriptional regulator [Asaia siamensis]GBR03492.1 transcriptional regulator [Asaia siamensis NRIC 0323]GGC38002.1 transcriptional regulator [Asaia siamensis]
MTRLDKLDLTQLRALDSLIATGSVTRTAEALGVTQPAVSNMLARLRDAFDDPLFIRQSRGLVCTPRARALQKPLRSVLDGLGALYAPPDFDPAKATLTLSLAATDYAAATMVTPFMKRLQDTAPGIRLALHGLDTASLRNRLEDGSLDMALVTPEESPASLHSQWLFRETWLCVTRPGHPVLTETDSLDAFCAASHVVVSPDGGGFEAQTDRQLHLLGRKRHVAVSVPGFLMVPELLKTTDLLAVLPARLVADRSDLAVFAPPLDLPGFDKYLVWADRADLDPTQTALRAMLIDTVSGAQA